MRVADHHLEQLEEEGFTLVPGFLEPEVLERARDAMFEIFPRPEAYFADPKAHAALTDSQFSGIQLFPYPSWDLNRLPVHDDLAQTLRDTQARYPDLDLAPYAALVSSMVI